MARRSKYKKIKKFQITVIIFLICYIFGYVFFEREINQFLDYAGLSFKQTFAVKHSYSIDNIPEYNNEASIIINNNIPSFKEEDKNTKSFERYSDLDSLGRCGVAMANISVDLMPKEERGNIGAIKPSGWHTIKYDFIDGKYLYNRCHLIGYQLTGENANKKNLITCTRSMNTTGMLEYENKVANYIKKTKNHVLYRVTPIFVDDELLARGVQMEAYSVEDEGKGISFNVFVYNVQDGVIIDYENGNSRKEIKE